STCWKRFCRSTSSLGLRWRIIGFVWITRRVSRSCGQGCRSHRVFGLTEHLNLNSITAIIPTIGRADSLRALLDSLAAQTHKPDEVIIADASNDPDTAHVVEAETRLT